MKWFKTSRIAREYFSNKKLCNDIKITVALYLSLITQIMIEDQLDVDIDDLTAQYSLPYTKDSNTTVLT